MIENDHLNKNPQIEDNNNNISNFPAYVITMVHGTFANNAPWINNNSEFSKRIQNNLKHKSIIYSFNWSGKNSHSARLLAGSNLAEHLKNLSFQFPESEQIVIAHSHGGNVALYAIKYLKNPSFKFKVVTMATPFLNVTLNDSKPFLALLPFAVVTVIFPLLLTLPLAFIVLFMNFISNYLPNLGDAGYLLVLGAGLLAIFKISIPSSIKLFKFLKNYNSIIAAKGEQILSKIDLKGFNSYKLLSVIYAGDEAKSWLSSSLFINRKTFYVYKVMNNTAAFFYKYGTHIFFFWMLTAIVLVITQNIFDFNAETSFKFYSLIIFNVVLGLFQLLLWIIPVIWIITLFIKSNPAVYGWESLYHIFLINLNVETKPVHMNSNTIVYESNSSLLKTRTIKHSLIYLDDKIIDDISEWIIKA